MMRRTMVTIGAALAMMVPVALAAGPNEAKVKECAKLMKQDSITLAEAVKTAEQHCNGQAVMARAILGTEGSSAGNSQNGRRNESGGQGRMAGRMMHGMQGEMGSQANSGRMMRGGLQFEVTCLTNQNQKLETLTIDGATGKVVQTRDTRVAELSGSNPGEMNQGRSTEQSGAYAGRSDKGYRSKTNGDDPPSESQRSSHAMHGNELAMTPTLRRASELIGRIVRNDEGKDIGKLSNIAIDSNNGCIAYGVLASGGFLDIGETLHAVPWSSFDISSQDRVRLNIDKKTLERSGGFSNDHWPTMANSRLAVGNKENENGMGNKSSGERSKSRMAMNVRILKASDIIGRNATGSDDKEIGRVADLAVDSTNARIALAVLAINETLGMGGELVAVPFSDVTISPKEQVQVSVNEQRVKNAPRFSRDDWSRLEDKNWIDRTFAYYNARPYWSGVGK